ncbi:MAG: hypothetical protein ACLU8W_12855 [Clostridia bacterium]
MEKHFSTGDFSVDDILLEARTSHDKGSGRKWSMEDIDALLADEPRTLLADETPEQTSDLPLSDATGNFVLKKNPNPMVEEPQAPVEYEYTPANQRPRFFARSSLVEKNEGELPLRRGGEGTLGTIKTADVRLPSPEEPPAEEPTRYFNKISDKPEPSVPRRRQDKVVDSPGFLSKESGLRATADLSPLPVIVAADAGIEDHYKNQESQPPAAPADSIEGQMFFSEFLQQEEPGEQIDEKQAEQELRKKRREKVKNFKINEEFRDSESFGEPLPPAEVTGEQQDDYNRAEDADGIQVRLRRDRVTAAVRSVAAGVLGVFAAAVAIAEQIRTSAGSSLFFPGGKTGLLVMNTVVLALCIAVGFPLLLRGIKGLLRLRPNADSPVLLATLAALIQTVALFFYDDASLGGLTLFAGLAGIELALGFAGKAVLLNRISRNFAFCSPEKQLYAVHSIERGEDAEEIGRGMLMGEPDIKYSARVKFPAAFFELSLKGDPADRCGRLTTLIVLAAGIIAGVVGGLTGDNAFTAITAMAAAVCAAVPAVSLLGSNLSMLRLSRECLEEGAMISGFPAVQSCEHTNAVAFDSSDIFASGGCNIHGIKTYHNMRIDEAILHTAALVIAAGGPCGEVFDRVIEGRRDLLPEVEELRYEDRLGLSAWVAGRHVIVGNREMLQHHNIETPPAESEKKYRHDGRQVMYLAISGKLAAMFVVSYMINEDIAARLREIIAAGVTVLIRTTDANITDELVEDIFGLEPNSVKIMSPKASSIYKRYHDRVKGKAPAYILHDGRLNSMLMALSGALALGNRLSVVTAMQKISATVNALIVLLLVGFSAFAQIGMWQLLILQAIWSAVSIFLANRHL